jgi:5-(carboxyamino)imidazole ribonucleotide synthase
MTKVVAALEPALMPVLAPAWLGVLGGGQLGRMFCHAAQSLGYKVCVLDPDVNSPTGAAADKHLQAAYLDETALAEMAALCSAVTTEFENVPAKALEFLAARCSVSPTAQAVSIAQDRILEKQFIVSAGAKVAPFLAIHSQADLSAADDDLFPALLKSARLGYDGKGQARVANRREASQAFQHLKEVACVLEKRLDLFKEVSVVLARGRDGQIACLPVAENEHRGGILAVSIVPARLDQHLIDDVTASASNIARALDYVGVLCVEFFIINSPSGLTWVVNEIAPRPHNSGHYSINACVTSQFEQQVRAMAQLPLGDSRLLSPAVMLNLLGDVWPEDVTKQPAWESVMKEPSCKLHLYGKAEARPGRKMGHITLVGDTQEALLVKAQAIERLLSIVQVD